MEARVSADSAKVSLRKAQTAAAAALDTLKSFLGLPLEQDLKLSHDATASAPPPLPDETLLIERAFAQRADLQKLALAVRLAELWVRQAEARSRPGVLLSGGYFRSGEAPTINDSFADLRNPSWQVGLSLTTSLAQKEDRASIRQARESLRLARMNEQLRRDEARLEIRRLLREVQDAEVNAALLAETVKRAEENLRIRQVQFEHGLVRPIDVMQTERQLNETRNQRLNALVDYQLARARLTLAVGEIPVLGQPEPESHTTSQGGQ